MDIPKYARIEAERRFLVAPDRAPDLATAPFDRIEDIYLRDTRLRLRVVTAPDGARIFRLCKKYPPITPSVGAIVNVYLTQDEHRVFAALPGDRLSKRRYGFNDDGGRVVIDVFEGALAGLRLTEFEADAADATARRPPPPWAGVEVTADPWFFGAALAATSAVALAERMAKLVEPDARPPSSN